MSAMITVAVDSFKGCLSSAEVNGAVKEGLVLSGVPAQEITCFPVSDGGEGFCSVIEGLVTTRKEIVTVHTADGGTAESYFLISGDNTAYIESALVCGYVNRGKRDPYLYSSFGLGELVRAAVGRGVRKIVVGLGGTCTVDAGVGTLQALGVRFYEGDTLIPDGVPAIMRKISRVDAGLIGNWSVPLEIWCDTGASFYGRLGAVRMFGAQKGLKPGDFGKADRWMFRMALLYSQFLPSGHKRKLSGAEGTGAAGGLGGALQCLPGAKIKWGAEEIIHLAALREHIAKHHPEMIITGEGKFDGQTQSGKLPAWISRAASECAPSARKICICGASELTESSLFDSIIPVTPTGMPLERALDREIAEINIVNAVRNLENKNKKG